MSDLKNTDIELVFFLGVIMKKFLILILMIILIGGGVAVGVVYNKEIKDTTNKVLDKFENEEQSDEKEENKEDIVVDTENATITIKE